MKKYKLSELFDLQMGKTPARNNSEYWENGTNPWISIADMTSNGKYITTTNECITERAVFETGIKPIFPGTVIMSFKLSVGKVARTTVKSYSNEAIMAFEIKDTEPSQYMIDNEYAYYLLSSLNFENIGNKAVMGKTLNKAILENTEVYIHRWNVQRKIISELDKVNELIELRKQQLSKLDELIKARFVEMFGHQSNNEKNMPFGKIDDVAEIYLGLTHTPKYVENGVKFISAKNTSCDYLDLSDVKYISREEFEKAPKGTKPQIGDVLFSRVGSNLGHPVILDVDEEFCTFVSLGFLRSKGQVTNVYLKHWMRDDFFAEQVAQKVVGGGQPNLNTGWLKEFKIIIPPMDIQEQFATFVEQVDKSKLEIQNSLEKLETLKKALMQKYFG